jgi:hypothetical protein
MCYCRAILRLASWTSGSAWAGSIFAESEAAFVTMTRTAAQLGLALPGAPRQSSTALIAPIRRLNGSKPSRPARQSVAAITYYGQRRS